MPHITLETTANVTMDFKGFFTELSEEMVATGHAPAMGIKCRVAASEVYHIIDGDPDYKMVNFLLRLREGRTPEVLETFSTIAMNLMRKYLHEDVTAKKIILSTEIKELKKGLDLTFNSVR